MVVDSIIKNVEEWKLNKPLRSQVPVKSIPGTTTKRMIHHVKICLEETSPLNTIILHHTLRKTP